MATATEATAPSRRPSPCSTARDATVSWAPEAGWCVGGAGERHRRALA
ncbi:MAG: hypothetical protein ACLSDQ_03910 [Adlercreutzia equolifaciens]